jgi:hypothetical protein
VDRPVAEPAGINIDVEEYNKDNATN